FDLAEPVTTVNSTLSLHVALPISAEGFAQRAGGAVPVQHIVVEGIEGREVEAAAEPPGNRFTIALGVEMADVGVRGRQVGIARIDRKSTRLNSSHVKISYAVFCLK